MKALAQSMLFQTAIDGLETNPKIINFHVKSKSFKIIEGAWAFLKISMNSAEPINPSNHANAIISSDVNRYMYRYVGI